MSTFSTKQLTRSTLSLCLFPDSIKWSCGFLSGSKAILMLESWSSRPSRLPLLGETNKAIPLCCSLWRLSESVAESDGEILQKGFSLQSGSESLCFCWRLYPNNAYKWSGGEEKRKYSRAVSTKIGSTIPLKASTVAQWRAWLKTFHSGDSVHFPSRWIQSCCCSGSFQPLRDCIISSLGKSTVGPLESTQRRVLGFSDRTEENVGGEKPELACLAWMSARNLSFEVLEGMNSMLFLSERKKY